MIIDSQEKMRARNMGNLIIIRQARAATCFKNDTRTDDSAETKQTKPKALNHQLVRLAIPAKALKRRVK
jgi:hypothetical protein